MSSGTSNAVGEVGDGHAAPSADVVLVDARVADDITRRKDQHLDLCARLDVEAPGRRTLLDCVSLVHCALPELDLADVDLETPFLGRTLRLPIMISGMTGGTPRGGAANRELARLSQQHGLALGLGSQRAMITDPGCTATYDVRRDAPDAVIVGNIGLTQARTTSVDDLRRLVDDLALDGLAIHLNVAQELAQPEGDRNFADGDRTIERVVTGLGRPVLVKETGCGISPAVARRLMSCGVTTIDVAGSGGTSWVAVEALRSTGAEADASSTFADWGIPTAAAVIAVRRACGDELNLIASGGLRNGLDMAKALALGADVVGCALPLIRALEQGGHRAADGLLARFTDELRRALLLTGSPTVRELRERPHVLGGDLRPWVTALEST